MPESRSRPKRVIGPAGESLTLDDLPPPDVKRWVTQRKAEVVTAVRAGLLGLDEVYARYGITPEEFLSWTRRLDEHGLRGLRVTRLRKYYHPADGPGVAEPQPAGRTGDG